VPPKPRGYCSRTIPRKISCQNEARICDIGTKTYQITVADLVVCMPAPSPQEHTPTDSDGSVPLTELGFSKHSTLQEPTTTVENYKIGTLVVDMFDTSSKNLIWRGSSSSALSGGPEKNDKNMNNDVRKMFQHFPPKVTA
jgi:hypothetical protein